MLQETIERLARQTGFSEYQIKTYLNRTEDAAATDAEREECIREAALFGIDIDCLGR